MLTKIISGQWAISQDRRETPINSEWFKPRQIPLYRATSRWRLRTPSQQSGRQPPCAQNLRIRRRLIHRPGQDVSGRASTISRRFTRRAEVRQPPESTIEPNVQPTQTPRPGAPRLERLHLVPSSAGRLSDNSNRDIKSKRKSCTSQPFVPSANAHDLPIGSTWRTAFRLRLQHAKNDLLATK